MAQKRVTQRDVALRAGVHRGTVSLVFRNHPSIPQRTHERVMKIAEELGYTPDPMLSALAAYRKQHQPTTFQGTLAWMINSSATYDWKTFPHFHEYFDGATSRAGRHGYKVEVFDLNTPQTKKDRIAAILRARSINGILLCPQPMPATEVDFPWHDFSALTFGYTLVRPQLHTVTATQYRSALRTIRELRALGYRRIGLAMEKKHDHRADHNYLAAYLVDEFCEFGEFHVPPFQENATRKPKALKAWIDSYRPDAVVTGDYRFLDVLAQIDYRAPEDLGVACMCLPSTETDLAGVVEDSKHIGEVAVDFLVAMIQRGERGCPENPQRLHVEGRWRSAKSVRRLVGPKIEP